MLPLEQFHPLVVHFPIVFVLCLAAFDLIALARGYSLGGRGCVASISAGLATLAGLAAIAAYILGDIALDIAVAAGTPLARLEMHEELGTTTAIALIVWAVVRSTAWWFRFQLAGRRMMLGIAVVETGLALLIITTAYFGGQLVYEFGVGVS